MNGNILRSSSNKGLSISFSSSFILENTDRRRGAILDITCQSSQSLLVQLTKEKAFGIHMEWLLLNLANSSFGYHDNEGIRLLSRASALPSSSLVLAQILENEAMVEYYDVYRSSVDADMKFLFLSRQPIYNKLKPLPAKRKRTDFDGVIFKAASAVLYPALFEGFSEGISNNPETDTYAKVGFVIEKNIAQQYNFSFTLKMFFNSYGYLENGSFTHMIGQLVKEELDFGAGVMMREDRMDFIDFAGNTFLISSPLIFKQPSLSSVSNIFLLPFQKEVWLATGGLVTFTTVLLFVEVLVTSQFLIRKKYPFLEVFMTIIECVCQQGSSLEIKSAAAKLTSLLFSIVSYFLFIAYSAKIVALLRSSVSTINTLPQLTNSHMTIGIQDVIYNRVFFQETEDKNVKELYYMKIYPFGENAFIPPTVGIKKIKSGFYAYKMETHWAYKLIGESFNEHEKCGLTELNIFVLPMISLGFPKKSGLREHFSRSVIWQQEAGIFQQTMNIFSPHKPICNANAAGYTKVHIMDFQPALLIFLYGILGSIMAFLLETLTTLRPFLFSQNHPCIKGPVIMLICLSSITQLSLPYERFGKYTTLYVLPYIQGLSTSSLEEYGY